MMMEIKRAVVEELYDANDVSLIRDRDRCKEICYQYNHLNPSLKEERMAMVKGLLCRTGANFVIEPNFFCDYGYNISIGEGFYSNHNLIILDGAKVTFGDHVFIAPNCSFYTAGHPLDLDQRNAGFEYARPITVGDNVWIGGNVVVLPGVTIGSGSTIGAGSVVSRDIPENVLAVGNPCKVLRELNKE